MSDFLNSMAEEIKEYNMNVFTLSEIRDGKSETLTIKKDSYCRDVYSVSKAYIMAAIGFLFDEGKITPNESVGDVFGKLSEGSDERWADVTIADALRCKTGLLNGIDVDCTEGIGKDWLKHIFSIPLDGVRGETYKYDDGVFYLLSRIVSKKTGMSAFDFLRDKLFNPLDYKEAAWSTCPQGYSAGGSGLYVSCSDMVKLGGLWLNNGVWNKKRIISEEWVKLSLKENYAFSLRSENKQGYYKTGAHSQFLYFSYKDNMAFGMQSFMPTEFRTKLVNDFFMV